MKVIATLSVLIGLAILSCQGAEESFSPEALCSIVKEGQHVKDADSCNIYYECVKGKPVKKECPEGQVFNKETVSCIVSNHCDPQADRDCKEKVDGFIADSTSCERYYFCQNGKVFGGNSCPNDLIFDATVDGGSCVFRDENTKCKAGATICSLVKSNEYFANPTNCAAWRKCSIDGSMDSASCGKEGNTQLLLDLTDGTCAYKSDCRQTTGGDPDTPATRPPPPPTTTCKENSKRFISDDHTCGGFYFCEEGKTEGLWGTCDNNQFFDEKNQNCVPRTDVICEQDRCQGIGKGLKWVGITGDGCRGFDYCQDGVKISGLKSGKCDPGLFFNEIRQKCVFEEVKHISCAGPPVPPSESGEVPPLESGEETTEEPGSGATEEGETGTTEEGEPKPTEEGENKPTEEGENKPTEEGENKPTEEGEIKTTEKGEAPTTEEGTEKPETTEKKEESETTEKKSEETEDPEEKE